MFITNANPETIAAFWVRARSMFARASWIIGAPQALIVLGDLTNKRRREIAGWLGLLESIVRKLLMAEAAPLVATQAPQPTIPRTTALAANPTTGRQANRRRNAQFDPTQPETWPAHFALAFPRDPRAIPESQAPRIRSPWSETPPPSPPPLRATRVFMPAPLRLALRFEALRRVIADPKPYVQRLARFFRRVRRRYPEVTMHYAIAQARPYFRDLDDPRLISQSMAVAMVAAPQIMDSS